VQLLSQPLHAQIFRNTEFPPPSAIVVRPSQPHLQSHGLDITQAQKSPNVSFTLPPLEGHTIDTHFWNIGSDIAGPSKELAKALSTFDTPPLPEDNVWQHRAGWTRYSRSNGDSDWKIEHDVGPYEETQLVFDVETMPKEHQYAVMASAVSPSAWYCWVSPWLLGESEARLNTDLQHEMDFESALESEDDSDSVSER
jgi:DNA polymerase gamma 1